MTDLKIHQLRTGQTAEQSVAAYCHALRGATCVPQDEPHLIHAATRELLTQIVDANTIAVEQIASAFFTVTADLTTAFPAKAARQLGWNGVALLCATEIPVPGALPSCLRVLIHFNANRPRSTYRSIYINGAEKLLQDDLCM